MKSRYVLHLVISNLVLENLMISIIYNNQKAKIQKKVWKELSRVAALEIPWCIIGDFNAIIDPDECKGDSYSYFIPKAHFFLDFIACNSLLDIGSIGSVFS